MAKWLASDVPEWALGLALLVGLPALMVFLQVLVHRRLPKWRRGEHNDVAGVMLSAAVVVYSVAIGLCVITLWEKLDDARSSTEAEATNLAALTGGAAVFQAPVPEQIRAGVIAYNLDVVDRWSARIDGDASVSVGRDLDGLVQLVSGLRPETQAQRAYVDDAVARLTQATELRAISLRLAREQQLPGTLWIAVLGGSVIVLGLCLTCGLEDRLLRGILLAGVSATVGINLFMVVELNDPFFGDIAIRPDSYQSVVDELRQHP
ncbi:MAG: DUF4239 domain-containing protein [Actinoplanes sp.]